MKPTLIKANIITILNEPNPKTIYGSGDDENAKVGYTDYPFLESKK